MSDKAETTQEKPNNFIFNIIEEHNASGRFGGRVHTRFPPEPNGYLHIGHAKAIWVSYGATLKYNGKFNLRFDDTNPLKEDIEFVDAIKEDIEWLGVRWDNLCFASDYFDKLYELAIQLIKKGSAYVCSLDGETLREYRGNHTTPGRNSPGRDRSIEENLDLFERMKNGEFKDGEHVLRAKIDMAAGNMNMRDPLLYRIRHAHHPLTGDKWCIYPLYDFTHGLSDGIEGITHSLCSLEFQDHRPLYEWFFNDLNIEQMPQQIEFSKLKLNYVAMGKRNMIELVELGKVSGWDDPRMPTLRGLRRRGYTPNSIKNFIEMNGVTKSESVIDMSVLEECLRQDLNDVALRRMAVLDPIKVTLTNYPEDKEEILKLKNHPKNEELGTRDVPFSNEIYIDREDFMEEPPPKYFRLKPGGSVRLRNAYVITFQEVIKDEAGKVIELKCTYDENTFGGKKPEGKKVKGIIHWVSAKHALMGEVRAYDRLFTVPNPKGDKEKDFKEFINPDSLKVYENVPMEPSLAEAEGESTYQFERVGYFSCDAKDSVGDKKVFNKAVSLKDTWAKETSRK